MPKMCPPLEPADEPQYPALLIKGLCEHLGARTNLQLAKCLNMPGSTISKLRSGKLRVSHLHIIRMYDASGLSFECLRAMLYQRPFKAPTTPLDPAYIRFPAKPRLGRQTKTQTQYKHEPYAGSRMIHYLK